jgi:hypothetical protein
MKSGSMTCDVVEQGEQAVEWNSWHVVADVRRCARKQVGGDTECC